MSIATLHKEAKKGAAAKATTEYQKGERDTWRRVNRALNKVIAPSKVKEAIKLKEQREDNHAKEVILALIIGFMVGAGFIWLLF